MFSEVPVTSPTRNYFLLLKTAVYTSLSETHFSPEVKRLQVYEMLLALSIQQSSASTCNLMKTAGQGIIYVQLMLECSILQKYLLLIRV